MIPIHVDFDLVLVLPLSMVGLEIIYEPGLTIPSPPPGEDCMKVVSESYNLGGFAFHFISIADTQPVVRTTNEKALYSDTL